MNKNMINFYQNQNININDVNTAIKSIGNEYLNGVFIEEDSPKIKKLYDELIEVNNELFKYIPFDVVFTSDDFYKTAKEMRERVTKEGVIYIYNGGTPHQFLNYENNLKGRAIHDVYAHLVCGCPFDFLGELNAYFTQRQLYPNHLTYLLFSEIPAQTAAYYQNNKNHHFKQRAIEAPERWLKLTDSFVIEYDKTNTIKTPFKPIK